MFAACLLLLLPSPPVGGAADTQPWRPLLSSSSNTLRSPHWQNRKQNQNRKQAKESGFHSTDFLHAFGSNIFNLITEPLNVISEQNITYDAEQKTLLFGDLEFSLLFAVEELILIVTEMVAYIATDQLMRAVWPV